MTGLEKLLAEVTPKSAREYLAEQYEYLNRYPAYADLARRGDGEFTMCSIRAIERAQEDLARKVIAAEKLAEALRNLTDIYANMEDGNGEPCPDVISGKKALTAWEALK